MGVRMSLMRGGFEVLAEVADGDAAVDAVLRLRPDVCLLDISMPVDGIEAAARIAEARITTRVVMLTVSTRTEDVIAALRAGAVGFLPKDTHPDRLPAALCGVLKGEAALPRALVGRVLHEFRGFTAEIADPVRVGEVELTGRESEILRMLHSGRSTMRDQRSALALADHRPPPHLRGRRQARRRRPAGRDPGARGRSRRGIGAGAGKNRASGGRLGRFLAAPPRCSPLAAPLSLLPDFAGAVRA